MPSDAIVGTTSSFGPDVPVAGLIVDQQAALLAEGCLSPGSAKCTYGTGAFLLAQLGTHASRSSAGLSTSVAWTLRGETSYCLDGQVFTAASAVRWAIDLGLVPSADELDAVAASAGETSDGVLCVPALAGLGAPWWDAKATASFTGMTLSHQRGHLVRALLEGIAAQVAALGDLVAQDSGQSLTRLRVDGGLTRSAVLMQAQADLSQIPIEVYPSAHATPLGAAACARLALDPGADLASVVGEWVAERIYEPRWSPDRAASYLDAWQRAAQATHWRSETPRTARLMTFDIAVIGAGIVGSAIARDLAGTSRSVVLIEARADVGDGTSKANTAILHTGFDAIPGTLESRLVARGHHLLGDYAARTGIPIERTGALLVAWDDEELGKLPELQAKAEANGYDECRLVDARPGLRAGARLGARARSAALTVPDESIICTWTTNLALATDAVRRGAVLRRGARVVGVRRGEGPPGCVTTSGDVTARWVINAAGLGADHLDRSFGHDRFTVTPRRGELFVFDKLARPKVPCIVLPVPSSRGKGVLVSPTIYGNVMLGPTSENLTDRTATGTSQEGFDFLIGKGRRLMPTLLDEEVTAAYAGLRAAIGGDDYLIDVDTPTATTCSWAGIRSTGLTAGMAIAEHVVALLQRSGLDLASRSDLPDPPRCRRSAKPALAPTRTRRGSGTTRRTERWCASARESARARSAMPSPRPIPPADLDGLRRRTRVMNGRCQGFYCGAHVRDLLSAKGSEPTEARRSRSDDRLEEAAVVIVGGGPAGLTAAAELGGQVDGPVLVIEREVATGGIPRHSDHLGYGLRDLRRFISGPAYARRLTSMARDAGAVLETQAMVTGWAGDRRLEVTAPSGRRVVAAGAVVLATGARERPRAARLIPGDRPDGVFTTGELQNLVHLSHADVGSRAVVIGAELVSWSAVLTLREAHCATVAMTTESARERGLRGLPPGRSAAAARAGPDPGPGGRHRGSGAGAARLCVTHLDSGRRRAHRVRHRDHHRATG